MQLPLMIVAKDVAERVRKGVVGARKMRSMECNPIVEALVPEVYHLHAKGRGDQTLPCLFT